MGADTAASGAAPLTTSRASGRKRKHAESATKPSANKKSTATSKNRTLAQDIMPKDTQPVIPPKKARLPKPTASPATEKRLRRFRPQPPKSFADLHARATTQRFYVLSRVRDDHSDPDNPEETLELTGSTGNIYTVTIARQPTCNCPHAREGNQCKHVVYVLARVLRAKFKYVYQLALLREELREIFEAAPPSPDSEGDGGGDSGRDGGGKRKPVEGDCPICFGEMDAADKREPVVWCRAACGQNVHKGCFETWAATKRRQAGVGGGSGEVTCPYCRSVWEGDEDMVKTIQKGGKRNAEGYVNVADQLGISTQRDYSTYSRWWSGHPSGYRRRYY